MGKYNEEQNILDNIRQSYSLLFMATNKLQAMADSKLNVITSHQLMILLAVAHLEPEESSIINISRMINATKQNTARTVSALCQKEYLQSVPSSVDKRSVNIQLTQSGRDLLKESIPQGYKFLIQIFEVFTKEELSTFRKCLEKLAGCNSTESQHFEGTVAKDLQNSSTENNLLLLQIHDKFCR